MEAVPLSAAPGRLADPETRGRLTRSGLKEPGKISSVILLRGAVSAAEERRCCLVKEKPSLPLTVGSGLAVDRSALIRLFQNC